MRTWVLTAIFFLMSAPAYAQRAGESCEKFGQTIVANDKKSVLACLRPILGDPASPLVWMLNTNAPKACQPNGDAGPEPFYTIGPERKAKE